MDHSSQRENTVCHSILDEWNVCHASRSVYLLFDSRWICFLDRNSPIFFFYWTGDKAKLMNTCKDDSVLSRLALWIVPFEQLHHLLWRLYNKPPVFQFCPHIIRNICSALLTQGWSLTEVLFTIYNRILHFRCECVHVFIICVCSLTYFGVRTQF